ncbi:MAG: homoserine dehydrogenase [Dehalococcoidia bacterium]
MGSRSQIGVGLMGLGVVGTSVARTLLAKGDYFARRVGLPLVLRRALVRNPDKRRQLEIDASLLTADADDILRDEGVDIVVEVMGGEVPAYDYLKEALAGARYVVTANKEVMAKHGPELLPLAHSNGVDVLYEASVGGGTPIIAPLRRDLLANDIAGIRAIINGTTNYILTRMGREGLEFAPALHQAQALGYAEADPSNDVDGTDAAYKLAILASLAFQAWVQPADVYREGIARVNARDFRYAGELGYAIKLLALARRQGDAIQARVHPVLLPMDEPLAKVDGVLNAVQVEGDLLGRALFQGPGAGPLPTASAVVADIVDAARRIASGADGGLPWHPQAPARVQPMSHLLSRFYLRMEVPDRPGVLAQIASVLGQNQISIASVIQKETNESAQTAEIVIMTHTASEGAMQEALRQMTRLEAVREIGNFLRVED